MDKEIEKCVTCGEPLTSEDDSAWEICAKCNVLHARYSKEILQMKLLGKLEKMEGLIKAQGQIEQNTFASRGYIIAIQDIRKFVKEEL